MFPTNQLDPLNPLNNSPQTYQVQSQDKDLLTLAANLQVPYQELKQANPNISSISQGQFIKVPAIKPPVTGATRLQPQGNTSIPTNSFLAANGTVALGYIPGKKPTNTGNIRQTRDILQSGVQQAQQPLNTSYINPSNIGSQDRLDEMEHRLNVDIQNGVTPQVIPIGVNIYNQDGTLNTYQDLLDKGFVYNTYSKAFELGGAGNAPVNNGTGNTPDWAQVHFFSKKLGAIPQWQIELRNRRANAQSKKRKAAALANQPAPIDETRFTDPSTVLNIRLGS